MPTAASKRWLILIAVMLAFVPIVIDMTILHIAVPSLTLALGASGAQVLWIIDIYPLLMAGLLVPMGTLADRVGHRRILLYGLSVFWVPRSRRHRPCSSARECCWRWAAR